MKTNKILILQTILFLGIFFTGCDDNMFVVKEVPVESVTISDKLKDGITLAIGTSTNIGWNVSLLPTNATDRAESFYSSDVNVATVSPKGDLTAHSAGTSEITISVGGKTAKFTLTVVDKIIVPATKIELAISELELKVGVDYNLMPMVTVTPLEANDGVTFATSDDKVVSVTQQGVLKAESVGTATITVASKYNPSVKATLPVTTSIFSGDYPRTNWVLTASQVMFKTATDAEKNSLQAAVDGDITTNFCMVRPGKNYGTNPNVIAVSGEALYFIVDMQQSQDVNYFRIRHRDTSAAYIRWYRFDEILGSNDGTTFQSIATNVTIPNAGTASVQESPDISIPKSKYRYIKFYAKEAACFYQSSYTSQGSSIQIQELYLGVKP